MTDMTINFDSGDTTETDIDAVARVAIDSASANRCNVYCMFTGLYFVVTPYDTVERVLAHYEWLTSEDPAAERSPADTIKTLDLEDAATPGSHISETVQKARAKAQAFHCNYRFVFNDITMVVSPTQTEEEVLATYDRLCEESAARWRASPEGIASAKRLAKELAKKQRAHDSLMTSDFPKTIFASTSEAISWLADYAEATNDIGVINQDYPKVVDCLKRSGFVVKEFVGEPPESFTADRVGRWLIGQAMHQMENLNMPPHENMVGIFSERYFTMLEDENNG